MIIEILEQHGDIMLILKSNLGNVLLMIDVNDWAQATNAARMIRDGFYIAGIECEIKGIME